MRVRKEAIYKAGIRDFTTYEAAEHKTGKFVLRFIEETWVRRLNHAKNYYTLVTMGQLLGHLQATCCGLHAIDVLTLQNKLQ